MQVGLSFTVRSYTMKILYIGVHDYKNNKKWRTETYVAKSLKHHDVEVKKIDYRKILKYSNHEALRRALLDNVPGCDAIFLQRGERIRPYLFDGINVPIIFWSTEPINRNKDVDILLNTDLFQWVYFHTYSCMERMEEKFSHLKKKSSVLHNALAAEKINFENNNREYFAIFNRNISFRRWRWLFFNRKLVKVIKGQYGEAYYKDLNNSKIAVNIHYSSKSSDDFETGIFEAMASGCVVVSENIREAVLDDLQLKNSIIQVANPRELHDKLSYLNQNIHELNQYLRESKKSLHMNTWDYRMKEVVNKFKEHIDYPS